MRKTEGGGNIGNQKENPTGSGSSCDDICCHGTAKLDRYSLVVHITEKAVVSPSRLFFLELRMKEWYVACWQDHC